MAPLSTARPPDIPYARELKRKLVHLFSLSIPLGIRYLPQKSMVWILSFALLGSLAVDLLRHSVRKNPGWWGEITALFRPREEGRLSGSSFLLLASLLMVLFFPRNVAVLSLAYMVVGDVAAALIGRKFGRHRFLGKSLEGSAAFFLAGLTVSFFIPELPFFARLLAALAAAVIEALPLKLDDNLTVPLGTGGVLVFFSKLAY